MLTGVIRILIMPWKLLDSAGSYIFNWLVGCSALLGPIAGIMIVDYWLIRRTRLDVPDLWDGRALRRRELGCVVRTWFRSGAERWASCVA